MIKLNFVTYPILLLLAIVISLAGCNNTPKPTSESYIKYKTKECKCYGDVTMKINKTIECECN